MIPTHRECGLKLLAREPLNLKLLQIFETSTEIVGTLCMIEAFHEEILTANLYVKPCLLCTCDVKLAWELSPSRVNTTFNTTIYFGTAGQATKIAPKLVTYMLFAIRHGRLRAINKEFIVLIQPSTTKWIPPGAMKKRN